jgi:hypothetical protein
MNLSDESLRSNKPEPLTQLGPAQSPAYEQGWRDGCATGLYVRGFRFSGAPLADDHFAQDAERFRTNKEYTVGWGDGMRTCDRPDLHSRTYGLGTGR